MAVSYNRLWKLLVDKKMSKADLRRAADLAPNTMTKLRRPVRGSKNRLHSRFAFLDSLGMVITSNLG